MGKEAECRLADRVMSLPVHSNYCCSPWLEELGNGSGSSTTHDHMYAIQPFASGFKAGKCCIEQRGYRVEDANDNIYAPNSRT